ncbi:GrpB family protein [Nesterenkonia halotolerans]
MMLSGLRIGVEHIGSTSAPGLAAKPIIHIVVTVKDITAEEDCLQALLAARYPLRSRIYRCSRGWLFRHRTASCTWRLTLVSGDEPLKTPVPR